MAKDKAVIDKICRQVKDAYDSKKPIIFIDTDEIELAYRVAGRCDFVDLKLKSFPSKERADLYYGSYIKATEKDLSLCRNFFTQFNSLLALVEKGAAGTPYDNRIEAGMFLLHLVAEPVKGRACEKDIYMLRAFVNAYVGSEFDDNSPIRSSCVILYGNPALLEEDLKGYAEIITPDYPDVKEIRELIREINDKYGDPEHAPEEKDVHRIAYMMRGFTYIQAEFCIKKMLRLKLEDGAPLMRNTNECIRLIVETKNQNLKHYGGLLELFSEDINEDDPANKKEDDKIAGMETFVAKTKAIKKKIGENSAEHELYHGTLPAKGCLLVGPPGTGKSEAARLIHRELNLPMIRLSFSRLMGGLVGESERNLRKAMKLIDASSPCVVWIDEVEKNLSGATSSSRESGGTFKRMFADFLVWLQEKVSISYVICTANDISNIPPEFSRNLRMDVRYGVFLPTSNEIRKIFAEQMKRAEKTRTDIAKERGAKISPVIFADECFLDEERTMVPDSIVKLFLYSYDENDNPTKREKIKFVSGADIAKLVSKALDAFENEELKKPLNLTQWSEKLSAVIDDPTFQTQCSSESDLNKIAACYIRMLRKNLVPVSDDCLFPAEGYVVKGTKSEYIDRTNEISDEYDKKMFTVIKERINAIAPTVEEIEFRKDCE